MAKTTAKNAIILLNAKLMSTYATSFEIDSSVDPIEVTGFSDGNKNFIPGLRTGDLKLDLLWDSESDTVHDNLNTIAQTGIATILPEGDTAGNPALSVNYMQANYSPKAEVSSAISAGSIAFASTPTSSGNVPGLIFGRILYHGEITDDTTGSSIDRGTSSSNGYSAILHVWNDSGGEIYDFVIEHSSNNSTWTTLATFSLDGTAVNYQLMYSTTASVNRYVRLKSLCTTPGSIVGFTATIN